MNNKYRGISKSDGKWCFGFLTNNKKGNYFIGYHTTDNRYLFQEVIYETIGQFTGCYDINKVEIYVGDSPSHGNFVEFSYGCFNINGDRPLSGYLNFEVIGNRYDGKMNIIKI